MSNRLAVPLLACAHVIAALAAPTPAAAQSGPTSASGSCGPACRFEVKLDGIRSDQYNIAQDVRITVTNTLNSPMIHLPLYVNPMDFTYRLSDSEAGFSQVHAGPHVKTEAGLPQASKVMLLPQQSTTFFLSLNHVPPNATDFSLMMKSEVLASFKPDLGRLIAAQLQRVHTGPLGTPVPRSMPYPPNGDAYLGKWFLADGGKLTLERTGVTLTGVLETPKGAWRMMLYSGPTPATLRGEARDAEGKPLARIEVQLQDGKLRSRLLGEALPLLPMLKADGEWTASRTAPGSGTNPDGTGAGQGPSTSPPAPPAESGAPTLRRWTGIWESDRDWIEIIKVDSGLRAVAYADKGEQSTNQSLQINAGASTPQELKGVYHYEKQPFDITATYGTDDHSMVMWFKFPATGTKPATLHPQIYRRTHSIGTQAPRPTLAAQLQRLKGDWITPAGEITLVPAGSGLTDLTGTFKTAAGNYAIKSDWDGPTDTMIDTDNLNADFELRSDRDSWSDMKLIMSPAGETLYFALGTPVGGQLLLTGRRRGAAPAPTEPGGASPTPPPSAPSVPPTKPSGDPVYSGGWGNGNGGGNAGGSPPTSGGGNAGGPPPASGGGSAGGGGGYVSVSKAFDVMFEGAKAARGSELHVFVSVKNMANHDAPITPGNFIPKIKNADGEWIVSRELFRASGEVPTSFRPTIPPGESVRVRFVFRPDAKSAQIKAFSLGVFEGLTHEWDVSGTRLASLAQ